MKLRITEEVIRLRLNEWECQEITKTKRLENTCPFPTGEDFVYSLSIADELDVRLSDHHFKITISNDQVGQLLQKKTISSSFGNERGQVSLVIEQDLMKSKN